MKISKGDKVIPVRGHKDEKGYHVEMSDGTYRSAVGKLDNSLKRLCKAMRSSSPEYREMKKAHDEIYPVQKKQELPVKNYMIYL